MGRRVSFSVPTSEQSTHRDPEPEEEQGYKDRSLTEAWQEVDELDMITWGGDAAAALVGGGEAHEADPDPGPAHGPGNGDDQRTEAARNLSACLINLPQYHFICSTSGVLKENIC